MSERREAITMDQVGCARCDGDGHDGITFQPLTLPVVLDGVCGKVVPGRFTHWAPCPTNGEPILLYVIDVPEPS